MVIWVCANKHSQKTCLFQFLVSPARYVIVYAPGGVCLKEMCRFTLLVGDLTDLQHPGIIHHRLAAGNVNNSVSRAQLTKELHPILDKLAAAIEVTPPSVMAEALAEFDGNTGLDNYYDRHVADPYWSVFGPSLEETKVAEFVWEEGAERCTGSDLEYLATNHRKLIEDQFGSDVADAFAKDPVAIFESMPTPQKIILARAASDK